MKPKSLAYIATVSLVLVLVAVFDPMQKHRAVPSDRLVSASQLASLTLLRLVDPSGSSLTLQRIDQGDWALVGEHEAPLDPNKVRELISVIGLLRWSREGPPLAASVPAKGTFIQMAWQGGGQTFKIGATTADAKHQWLLVGDKALLVARYLVAQLLALRSELVSRKLFAVRPSKNAPLELRRDETWVRVEEGEVQWPGLKQAAPGSPASTAQLRESIARLEFLEELPSSTRCDETSAQLRVSEGDAVTVIDECGPCLAGRVGLRLGTRSGCVDAALWDPIVSALAFPVGLVGRSILPTRVANAAFTLGCGKDEILIQPSEVDDRRLQHWWRSLDNAAVTVREGDAPAAQCTLRGDNFELEFGKADSGWLAFVPGRGLLWPLAPEAATLLNATHSDFLSLGLIEEEPLHAIRIVIGDGRRALVLERGELASVWHGGPNAATSASQLEISQWALGLRSVLSTLRAVSFVDEGSGSKRSAAAGRIAIDYQLPTSAGRKRYKLLVAPAKNREGQCWVQVDALPPAWISAEACQVLLAEAP